MEVDRQRVLVLLDGFHLEDALRRFRLEHLVEVVHRSEGCEPHVGVIETALADCLVKRTVLPVLDGLLGQVVKPQRAMLVGASHLLEREDRVVAGCRCVVSCHVMSPVLLIVRQRVEMPKPRRLSPPGALPSHCHPFLIASNTTHARTTIKEPPQVEVGFATERLEGALEMQCVSRNAAEPYSNSASSAARRLRMSATVSLESSTSAAGASASICSGL